MTEDDICIVPIWKWLLGGMTAGRRQALMVRLREAMAADSDGNAWTPPLSVIGCASGFYTIQVTK